jgi:hypothetical protein
MVLLHHQATILGAVQLSGHHVFIHGQLQVYVVGFVVTADAIHHDRHNVAWPLGALAWLVVSVVKLHNQATILGALQLSGHHVFIHGQFQVYVVAFVVTGLAAHHDRHNVAWPLGALAWLVVSVVKLHNHATILGALQLSGVHPLTHGQSHVYVVGLVITGLAAHQSLHNVA